MKKKIVLGIVIFLLVLQAQMVFAADYDEDFLKAVGKNDFKEMEKILDRRTKQMDLAYCTDRVLQGRGSSNNIIPVLELLHKYGADFRKSFITDTGSCAPISSLFRNKNVNDTTLYEVLQYLLKNGADPNGAFILGSSTLGTPLGYALDKPQIFNLLLDNRADINARSLGNDKTLLFDAAYSGNLAQVKMLVEKGANINSRAKNGSTAASVAYDRGNIEIYNYLKANGAIDFEPRQVAAQPAAPAQSSSTTNVYVQPSTPTQTQSTPSTPTLQSGNYAWSNSGVNMTMRFNSITGTVSANLNNLPIWSGTYRINGNQLVISVTLASGDNAKFRGQTYSYTITSDTSFSGSGETWVRIGL